MGLFGNISKNGTIEQLKALEQLGKANLNAKNMKLGTSYDASVFQGNFSNFKDSALGTIMSENELKTLFTLLDADGNGEISETEIGMLAGAGKGGEAGKIDNNDIVSLISSAEKAEKNSNVKTDKTTGEKTETIKIDDNTDRIIKTDKNGKVISSEVVKKGKDGKVESKEISYPDGSKKEVTYNKDGKVAQSVKTDVNGQTKTTNYTYDKNGNKTGAESVITRKDPATGEEYVAKKQTYTYENGKKTGMVETDADGNKLSETTYQYDSKTGKLLRAQKVNTDGTVENTNYDKDGNKTSKTVIGANGKIDSSTQYDKDGNKIGKTKYEYDENGNKTAAYMYDYKDGEVSARTKYDASGKPVLTSKYETFESEYGKEVFRTDVDPNTNEVTGYERLAYNKYNQLTSTLYKDKDGKDLYAIANNYDHAGKMTSQDKITYETDANGILTIKEDRGMDGSVDSITYRDDAHNVNSHDFDADGKIDEMWKFNVDANGNTTSMDRYSYETDANGILTIKEDINDDGKIDSITYRDDANNTNYHDFDADGNIDEVWKFDLDANGNVKRMYTDKDADGKYDYYEDYDPIKKQYGAKVNI